MRDKIKLLPLLFLYIFIVLVVHTDDFQGDEGRYVVFASNLLNGHYSPIDYVNLWNGPGYPAFLVPFIFLKLPWITAKLFNILFSFLAILYFHSTLRFYMQERSALFFAYMLGLYPPFCRFIHMLLTEQMAIFLVCGFLFHFCKLHHDNNNARNQMPIAAAYLGCLALTKIFFGYVIMAGLLLSLFLYLWKKRRQFRETFLVYSFALIVCVPYLAYTYSLTGQTFYWGNSGGMSLYWMSSFYDNELGDWKGAGEMSDNPELLDNHREFYNEIAKLRSIERDAAYKKRAIENIMHHPLNYFRNWLANIGRLLFNYPYSYHPQKLSTYFYIIPNMFLVLFSVLCIYPSFVGKSLIPYEIYALLIFSLISFGGSSLLSAYYRQFMPLVPIFTLWIAFTLTRIVKVEIRQ